MSNKFIALTILLLAMTMALVLTTPNVMAQNPDLNGDGKVDIQDIAEVAAAFGSYPGHQRWDQEADLNQDGYVNIIDVLIVANSFGEL